LNCAAVGARGGIQSVWDIEHLMATGARHQTAECTPAPTSIGS
jgi:hypothetical protein